MSWTYQQGANPQIDYPRLLIPDTNPLNQIFSDEEINSFTAIQALQFQSSMFYSAPQGSNLPSTPVSYLRVAAMAIDVIANNQARLLIFEQVLDVKLGQNAAKILGDRARELRCVDGESGAFVIIETVKTASDLRDRYWAQIQRMSGN